MSHRNEPARERRRKVLKEQLSLRSIPLVEPPLDKYNLDNHFGWKVLQRCKIGDGSFPPYLLHCIYCDKPDVPSHQDGGDYDKVMYVLYIRGKDGDLEPVGVKETQTGFSNMHMVPKIAAAPPPTEKNPKRFLKRHSNRPQHSNKKVISDFYYIPVRERIIDTYNTRPVTAIQSGGDVAEKSKGKKKKKAERARSSPKSWQLRAGAESPVEDNVRVGDTTETDISSESETEEEEEEEEETPNTFIDSLKKYDCTNCFSKSPTNAELMESPLEKNRYLYLPRESYIKRPTSARPTSPQSKSAQPTSEQSTPLFQPISSRPTSARPTSATSKSIRINDQDTEE